MIAGLELLDRETLAREPLNGDGLVRYALPAQEVLDHLAGRSARREDRERITAHGMGRPRHVDSATARVVARPPAA